jgi:hypothetical protein
MSVILLSPTTGEPAERVTLERHVDVIDVPSFENEAPAIDLAASPEPSSEPTVDPFPGHTYGNLDDASCIAELDARDISYERYGHYARGVRTPVHLMGALHGVRFRHADMTDFLASAQREILDCRLVLALDDLAAVLATRGYTTVLHYGVYRSDVPLPKHGPVRHHTAALAIDVASFVKDDGTHLDVRRDWRGHMGEHTCEDGAPEDEDKPSHELRGILCEVARAKLFHQVLTPNHDAQHWNHFHLEVMRDSERTVVE